ncbi:MULTISPECIES: alpha/beta fold hydrolase [unclassified Wenzhouxiangella]|uniref:alpha/beta fold hydrolase n=1 Tax=unclassified Wenzhouxiangella TaxID=2613841 RepID=UPI000E326C10|nr:MULTISPECIES: alpha/beta fold hydrolase [unclassified Wenzhouxiangella]RFF27261.1 alpha/beta fold hydrolase [Wenzhouxiangella sp. 15181]RFP69281.1 alpha/beta fold hydrolase [Wenzhouxiangella sp. 15190]
MAKHALNNASLNVVESGTGDETLVLLHGLLFSHRMFDAQVAALQSRFRCVRMDFRGQGDSEVTRSGYDLDTLADDAIALIESLDCGPVNLLGFSMGGMVAQRVALKRPDLLRSLVLMNTSAEPEPISKRPRFALLNLVARFIGLKKVAPKILPILFSERFIEDPAYLEERERWLAMVTANDRIGVSRAVHGVVSRKSILERIHQIQLPTLIIAADQDRATPPARARNMQERIDGSKLVMIEDSGHMTTAEKPDEVNRVLEEFYASLSSGDRQD